MGTSTPPDNETGSTPRRVLPDPKVCKARGWIASYALCLVDNPLTCDYVISFNTGCFCSHPEREKIVARTKAADKKSSST